MPNISDRTPTKFAPVLTIQERLDIAGIDIFSTLNADYSWQSPYQATAPQDRPTPPVTPRAQARARSRSQTISEDYSDRFGQMDVSDSNKWRSPHGSETSVGTTDSYPYLTKERHPEYPSPGAFNSIDVRGQQYPAVDRFDEEDGWSRDALQRYGIRPPTSAGRPHDQWYRGLM